MEKIRYTVILEDNKGRNSMLNKRYSLVPGVLFCLVFCVHCVFADDLYQIRGYNYVRDYKYEEAISEYNKSLAMDPDNAKTYDKLGYCYQMLSQPSKAKSYFQKAIEISPDYAEAYCSLGDIHGTSGEWEKARLYLDKALKIDPDCIEAYMTYGNLYFISKKYDQAIPYLEKAKKLMQLKDDHQFLEIIETMLISAKEEIGK